MSEPHPETRLVQIAPLGERLSALRLCEATALASVGRSLAQHGQLSALTLFATGGGLEIIDGFKRVRAARALGWSTLLARIDDVGSIDAKLRLRELHDRRGLTELEEAWLVRSLGLDEKRAAVAGVLRLVPPDAGAILAGSASAANSTTTAPTSSTRSGVP